MRKQNEKENNRKMKKDFNKYGKREKCNLEFVGKK